MSRVLVQELIKTNCIYCSQIWSKTMARKQAMFPSLMSCHEASFHDNNDKTGRILKTISHLLKYPIGVKKTD